MTWCWRWREKKQPQCSKLWDYKTSKCSLIITHGFSFFQSTCAMCMWGMTTWELWSSQIQSIHRESVSHCWTRWMQKDVDKYVNTDTHFHVNLSTEIEVCFSQVLEDFSKQVDSIDWPSGNPETINYKALDVHLAKYQVSEWSVCLKTCQRRGLIAYDLGVIAAWEQYKCMWCLVLFVFFVPTEPQRSRCNDQSAGRAGRDKDHFGKTSSLALSLHFHHNY